MFDIIIEGEPGFERAMANIERGLVDVSAPTQAALMVLSESVLARIVNGIEPDILPESRARRQFDTGTPPLWDGGAMAAAATATHTGQEGSTYQLAPDGEYGQIGVEDLFHGARRHQFGFGTDVLGRNFNEPARAFMVKGEGDDGKVVEVFDRYLTALVGKEF